MRALCCVFAACALLGSGCWRTVIPTRSNDPTEVATWPPNEPPTGYLTVYTEPTAEVLVDGVSTGKYTPLTRYPLSVGEHAITLTTGAQRVDLDVIIRKDKETHITRSLATLLECFPTVTRGYKRIQKHHRT